MDTDEELTGNDVQSWHGTPNTNTPLSSIMYRRAQRNPHRTRVVLGVG